ncbi:glutamate--cysteine ligase regulatory subunit [Hyalella azteca]|uniref:GCS light chain n=1 Tax=Hyalella azteca TaxID=294128 RepID=A0A8B7N2G2_HYAAZ|nr:glutamate--cysteine ligase regulatory subunit [Hyalella azteca]
MAVYSRRIIVQTGNIIDMEDQIRLVGQSSSEELKGCVKSALNQWEKQEELGDVVVVQGRREPLLHNSARGISTTAKIFLCDNSGDTVLDAVKTVMKNVDRQCIESVIVAPPDVSDDSPLQDLIPTWRALEGAVHDGIVSHIGIADASYRLFKELYEWAEVKPSTLQINVDDCCTVSEPMTEFARTHDVQILTHSDDHEMLDEDVVSSILGRVGAPHSSCRVRWLARHRTIHTCFGLILDKGYTIALDCDD